MATERPPIAPDRVWYLALFFASVTWAVLLVIAAVVWVVVG